MFLGKLDSSDTLTFIEDYTQSYFSKKTCFLISLSSQSWKPLQLSLAVQYPKIWKEVWYFTARKKPLKWQIDIPQGS